MCFFLHKRILQSGFFWCCRCYCFGWFLILILGSWSLGTVVYFGGLVVLNRVIRENELITLGICKYSLKRIWGAENQSEGNVSFVRYLSKNILFWFYINSKSANCRKYVISFLPVSVGEWMHVFKFDIYILQLVFKLDFFQCWVKEWLWFLMLCVHNWVHFMAQLKKENNDPGNFGLTSLIPLEILHSLHFQTHKYLGSSIPFPECCVLSFHYCQHSLGPIFVSFFYFCCSY